MLTLPTRTGIVRPVPAAGPGPATISCPGAITGRERVTAAADRLSDDQLAVLSLGQMCHHQVIAVTGQLQHLGIRHGALERDGVPSAAC
jgi:hypothetical protein